MASRRVERFGMLKWVRQISTPWVSSKLTQFSFFFFLFFFSLVFPLFFFSFHFCLFFLLSSTYSSATLLQSTLLRNSCSHYTTDATSFYLSSSLDHSLYFHYDACHRLWLYHHLKSLMLIKGQTILILSQCVYVFVCSCVQSYLNYFLFYLFIYYYLLWFNFIFVCFFFLTVDLKLNPLTVYSLCHCHI